MNRIALTGKMGCGKSYIADLLESEGYERLHFATPLKRAAAELSDTPSRELLQALSEVTREVEPHPLVQHMAGSVARLADDQKVVIDDLRFPDELDALRSAGFTCLRVHAPLKVRLERLQSNGRLEDESQLEHPSEVALDEVDLPVLVNDGSRPDRHLVWLLTLGEWS